MQRLLLAEDDWDLRELLTDFLESEGVEVVAVADGRAALERLARAAHDFDVALLDVRMPLKTGLEVLREAREAGVTLPIALVTSFSDDEIVEQARRFGAACIIAKPYDPFRLRDVLRGVVEADSKRSV
jgi:CheY-like chemotaxis protein